MGAIYEYGQTPLKVAAKRGKVDISQDATRQTSNISINSATIIRQAELIELLSQNK